MQMLISVSDQFQGISDYLIKEDLTVVRCIHKYVP
jgi:hypothetical protein